MSLFGGSGDELKLKVSADTTDATSKMEGLGMSVSKLATGFVVGNVATAALSKGMDMLTGFMGDSIKSFEESENVVAQMNAALQSTGHAAGMSGKELVDLSQHLQSITTYSDEAVLSAENMLLTFTNISKDTFPAATEAALNMSTALGQDLKSSSIQLGKALNDPIQGVNALARVGVNFSDAQKEVIATMVKTGNTLGAQKLILGELSKEFGGSATAAAKTFQGQMEQLKNKVDDIQEGIGHGLTAAMYNLLTSFEDATAGMGSNVDIGKIVFQTLAFVEEAAVNTGVGIYELAGAFVYVGSYIGEAIGMLNGWDKAELQFWDDFRSSTASGMETAKNFALDLQEKNAKTSASFNDMTIESGKFANKGPAAYQQTAQAASDAADKIKEANKAIADTMTKISDLVEGRDKQTSDNRAALGEAYVKQEQNIADLRKQIGNETDQAQRIILQNELNANIAALASKKDIEQQYHAEVLEARRRAAETEFERSVEDINKKAAEDTKAFRKKMDLLLQELAQNEQKRYKLAANETAITATAVAESAKRTAAVTQSANEQVAQYARVQRAAQSAYTVSSGPFNLGTSFTTANSTPATLTGHEFGGVVPGPMGEPRLIMAHGQERVIPAGQGDAGGTASGLVVNFNNLSVSGSDDVQKIKTVLEDYFRPLLVNYKLSM